MKPTEKLVRLLILSQLELGKEENEAKQYALVYLTNMLSRVASTNKDAELSIINRVKTLERIFPDLREKALGLAS